MCDGMWTRCPSAGGRCRSRSAAASAFSGFGDASTAWMYRCRASGWSGLSFSTASRVATISGVSGCGLPSAVHRSHGRRSISDSAYSAPMSASVGNCSHAAFIASAYASSSGLRSSGGGSAYRGGQRLDQRLVRAADAAFAFARACWQRRPRRLRPVRRARSGC